MFDRHANTAWIWIIIAAAVGSGGCTQLPSMKSLDLMSPSASFLFPDQDGPSYRMMDGTPPAYGSENSMDMTTYERIREAKNQNAVVLQVAGDPEPIRVLPLPPSKKSAFVSELLEQTGVRSKFGTVQATVYRPSPESLTGIRMDVRFNDAGEIDPATDYALRPGDRVQVSRKATGGMQSLVDLVMRR